MSRPPSTIHIKRKATDDPVDVLRVHELNGKRQRRATEFVFTRQSIPLAANDGLGPAQQAAEGEGARRIKPLPRSSGQSSVAAPPETVTGATVLSGKQREETRDTNNDLTSQLDLDSDSEITSLQIAQHRRFHISRTSVARGRQSPVIGGKIQKRAPTVFVERRPQTPNSRGEKPRVKAEPRPSTTRPATIDQLEAPRRQKKPGRSARTTPRSTSQPPGAQLAPTSTSRDRNIRLPSGLTTPWDVTSEQLAKELEAYTLEEIGRNIAESSVTGPQPPSRLEAPSQPGESVSFRIKKGTPSKFKPKMPAQRYRDRHPEAAAPAAEMEGDRDLTDDDSDFVIDTYVRMPAEDVKVADKNHVGYIVLEDQPDIDEFYEEDDQQNEEDEEYDEDDENAENHYTADYPDEEVDSDDEYDRNPYRYRNGNASDEEEFDENDYDEMDEDDDAATRYPWLKPSKPSWMRNGNGREENGDEGDDDDDASVEIEGTCEDGAGRTQEKGGDREDECETEDKEAKEKHDDEDMKDAHHAQSADDAKPNGTAPAKAESEHATALPEH